MKNYIYMYELFVKPTFGKKKLVQVKNRMCADSITSSSTIRS